MDHPRVCGKNLKMTMKKKCNPGSPPRVREKLADTTLMSSCAWDHPRVCGKNLTMNIKAMWLLGSPPRVREKLSCVFSCLRQTGITPACAGKTLKDPIETANLD